MRTCKPTHFAYMSPCTKQTPSASKSSILKLSILTHTNSYSRTMDAHPTQKNGPSINKVVSRRFVKSTESWRNYHGRAESIKRNVQACRVIADNALCALNTYKFYATHGMGGADVVDKNGQIAGIGSVFSSSRKDSDPHEQFIGSESADEGTQAKLDEARLLKLTKSSYVGHLHEIIKMTEKDKYLTHNEKSDWLATFTGMKEYSENVVEIMNQTAKHKGWEQSLAKGVDYFGKLSKRIEDVCHAAGMEELKKPSSTRNVGDVNLNRHNDNRNKNKKPDTERQQRRDAHEENIEGSRHQIHSDEEDPGRNDYVYEHLDNYNPGTDDHEERETRRGHAKDSDAASLLGPQDAYSKVSKPSKLDTHGSETGIYAGHSPVDNRGPQRPKERGVGIVHPDGGDDSDENRARRKQKRFYDNADTGSHREIPVNPRGDEKDEDKARRKKDQRAKAKPSTTAQHNEDQRKHDGIGSKLWRLGERMQKPTHSEKPTHVDSP
ncbi:hypothetical protein DFH11DRAFT_894608 [Phellopilus nigrolimitatus]|nr:hypothetical protein DFH11DRAFT_894608 [Phellopilus nigrolimitatus]